MTSQDNQQYITVELFDSKMETLITQIKLGNEQLRNEFNLKINDVKSDLKNEIQGVKSELHDEIQGVKSELRSEIQGVKTELHDEIQEVKSELRNEIQGVKTELHDEIQEVKSELRSEIQAVDANVKANSARIEMLTHSLYWGFAIMTIVITVITVLVPYFMMTRKDRKHDDKATSNVITEDKVRRLIREVLQDMSVHSVGK